MLFQNRRLLANRLAFAFLFLAGTFLLLTTSVRGQEQAPPPRGSLIEDRAARKLVDAGDARYDVDELKKAVEI